MPIRCLSAYRDDIMAAGSTAGLLRQLLAETFAELGATGPMVRTIRLRDSYFAGHSFRCGTFQAVVLAGGDEIAFYKDDGELLKTLRLQAAEHQKAA